MLTRRAHVLLPQDLVIQIDALVGKRRRSAFLTEIARREVKRRRLQAFLASDTLAWNPDDHPEIDAAGGAAAWVKTLRRESDRSSARRIRHPRP
jgi:hypothetical protein